ncbi:CBS domain-containing protein [Ferrovibrio sp.]|uniref:CBS domain-containing protein n=1 Tax=Ferrovibrio sp. TaxID=1917215 RepID=UPI0026352B78|nr:CBS domain-containing protein [Ferrovibrio sp.]
MRVSEIMSRDVLIASPQQSIAEAAQAMAANDIGSLPVGENDELVGMITDRDIAIRGVGKGCAPDTPIRDVMTRDIKYCFEDEELAHVTKNMGDIQVRRLPVLNRDKRLVGIVSLGDIALDAHPRHTVDMVRKISEPGGQHGQSLAGIR